MFDNAVEARLAQLERENAALQRTVRRLSCLGRHIDSGSAAGAAWMLAQRVTAAAPYSAPAAVPLASPTHDEQLAFFRENGYLLVDRVLRGAELVAVQGAFAAQAEPLRQQWEAGVRDNDIGVGKETLALRSAMEHSDTMLSLIDRPELLPLLMDLVGADVQLRQVQVQSILPTRDAASGGHVNWHRDKSNYHHSSRSIWVKAFIYFSDVPEHGACTTVVPRSHTGDAGPPEGFSGFGIEGKSQAAMPGAVRVARRAGDALLFDTRVW
jgi:ectoine hydroxylase-related dioxygenase (phytanoyl-CoA dioxygenase family)